MSERRTKQKFREKIRYRPHFYDPHITLQRCQTNLKEIINIQLLQEKENGRCQRVWFVQREVFCSGKIFRTANSSVLKCFIAHAHNGKKSGQSFLYQVKRVPHFIDPICSWTDLGAYFPSAAVKLAHYWLEKKKTRGFCTTWYRDTLKMCFGSTFQCTSTASISTVKFLPSLSLSGNTVSLI